LRLDCEESLGVRFLSLAEMWAHAVPSRRLRRARKLSVTVAITTNYPYQGSYPDMLSV